MEKEERVMRWEEGEERGRRVDVKAMRGNEREGEREVRDDEGEKEEREKKFLTCSECRHTAGLQF